MSWKQRSSVQFRDLLTQNQFHTNRDIHTGKQPIGEGLTKNLNVNDIKQLGAHTRYGRRSIVITGKDRLSSDKQRGRRNTSFDTSYENITNPVKEHRDMTSHLRPDEVALYEQCLINKSPKHQNKRVFECAEMIKQKREQYGRYTDDRHPSAGKGNDSLLNFHKKPTGGANEKTFSHPKMKGNLNESVFVNLKKDKELLNPHKDKSGKWQIPPVETDIQKKKHKPDTDTLGLLKDDKPDADTLKDDKPASETSENGQKTLMFIGITSFIVIGLYFYIK